MPPAQVNLLSTKGVFFFLQNVREPSSDPQPSTPPASIPKSGSSGMIQYLQSWFPGWGGWYGDSQDPDRPEELLPSPSSWDILGGRLHILLQEIIPDLVE